MKFLNQKGEAALIAMAFAAIIGIGSTVQVQSTKAKAKMDMAHQADRFKKKLHYQKYHAEAVAKEKAAERAWLESQDYKIQ